jgi:DNA-binding response OmpR family regulator
MAVSHIGPSLKRKGDAMPRFFCINGMQIGIDDANQQLTINGRNLHLGRLEYLTARSLVLQYAEGATKQYADRLVTISTLCQVTGAPSGRRLHNLVSEVRNKLQPFELDIKSVRGDGYYLQPVGNGS